MPAVSLEKLKIQSANLVVLSRTPDLFVDNLRDLLDSYADRSRRGPQKVVTQRFIPSYHVPERVIWQIEHDLAGRMKNADYGEMTILAQTLWDSPSMEEKLLAVHLLGLTPFDDVKKWVEIFERWATADLDPFLLTHLVDDGLNHLRRSHFEAWLALMQEWLKADEAVYISQGIQSLANFVQADGSRHLPAILEMLHGIILKLPKSVHLETVNLIGTMAKISPVEMRYFLRELICEAGVLSRDHQKLLRNLIDVFPEEDRIEFKRELFARSRTTSTS